MVESEQVPDLVNADVLHVHAAALAAGRELEVLAVVDDVGVVDEHYCRRGGARGHR